MKKLFSLVTLLLVVAMLVVPVSAAQTATVSLVLSKDTVAPGATFTVTVNTTELDNCFSGGFLFDYDEEIFEYVSGSALVTGYSMSGISTVNNNVAGYFMNIDSGATVKGGIFQITLKVKDTVADGSYTISGIPSLTILNGTAKEEVTCTAEAVTITVDSTVSNILLGDANGDGKVNLKDAILVLKGINGGAAVDPTASDVNKDGKVNLKDAILVLKFVNGTPFPA